jgi:SAM-dependent methyltransferase
LNQPNPEVKVITSDDRRDFVVDLSSHQDSIVLTRGRRLHTGIWDPLFAQYGSHKALNFLEIGCQEGGATTWFLTNLLGHPDSRMTGIDIFDRRGMYDTFLHNINAGGWTDKVAVYVEKSGEALRRLPLYSYDIIYLDGQHSSYAVIEDTILAFRLLKEGGILLFDDYTWDARSWPLDNPKPAIDFFLDAFEGKYELLVKTHQLAIRKTLASDAQEGYRRI